MNCSLCGSENPAEAIVCFKCSTPLPAPKGEMTTTGGAAAGWSSGSPSSGSQSAASSGVIRTVYSTLELGSVLGNRYEVLQMLGEGGMGAVYKVRDREVDRFVALKVIRPDLANRPEILQRFKQELILARQVTHKNVIRIFDLGEADGVKFITMDFIDGRDLKSLLREKGKFSPEEACKIVAQVCRALDAAHSEGVVHRDLKPQNIMLDAQGRVTVMDFGIARSLEMPGMTQTGALVGTPEYMSPEQAKGEEVDARSDLFTLGIIFYELLTGKTPYRADTALATMLKRTQERARPPVELDAAIPRPINNVVMKCLEIDREQRYGGALEILHELGQETRTGTRSAIASAPATTLLEPLRLHWKWAAGGLAVLLLVIAVVAFRGRLFSGSTARRGAPGESVTLAILPFRNASGDQSLEWLGSSLAEMLRTDVGQSSNLHTVSSDRLHQILSDLRISADANFDPATLRRVAEFTNADRLVWGQYAKFGDQIRIDATLEDMKKQRSIPLKVEAPSEKDLLKTVDQLAKSIQENLTLAPSAVKELQASAFTPSSQSVQALRDYSEGLELSRQGNHLEALKRFEAATKDDPKFALAFAEMGQTYSNLGYDKEAEQFSGKAVDLSENLPPAEKYLIQGNSARIKSSYDKAIESYENLAKLMPDDPQVQFDLASLYEAQSAFDQAHDHYARVVERDPKYVDALLAVGRVEIKRGNPQASLDPLNRALSLAVQLDNKQGKANVLQAIGVAYRYLNKPDDALRNYQESLAIKKEIGDKRGMAISIGEIAVIHETNGKPDLARKDYEDALKVQREIGNKRGTALTLMNLGDLLQNRGQYDEALKLTKEALQIHLQLGDEANQALCLNNIGNIYFSKGQRDDALTYFQQALQLREKLKVPSDIAATVYNLGLTDLKMGRYEQAMTNYLRALESWRNAGDKRGVAIASDGMATLFEFQGRYGAASNSEEEALKTFQQLQDRSESLAEILGDHGNALILIGRGDEAQKNLEEALSLARELQNNTLIAQTLNIQGDRFFYRGDFKSARPVYEQALQSATRAADKSQILTSKFNLAKLSVKEGHPQAAIAALKGLARDADTLGLKFLSVECSEYLAEALLATKNASGARQELEEALRKSQDLGLGALLPKIQFLLAEALRSGGNQAEATRHMEEARKLLEDMHKESHSDALLKREDLKSISAEASR